MSHGRVTEALLARVRRQVDEHGLVLWLDPERLYGTIPQLLAQEGVPVQVYQESVFEVRRRIDSVLSEWERPRLVVYVPLPEAQVAGPLAELAAAATVLKPGQQPPARNTRLAVVARSALADHVPAATLESIIRQVEAGKFTLADVDQLGEHASGAGAGTLSLVFGTSNAADIVLQFLASAQQDTTLVEKEALAELRSLLSAEYGFRAEAVFSPGDLRQAFARLLLGTELISALGEDLPKSLRDIAKAEPAHTARKALDLVRTWRHRRDLQGFYVDRAAVVERELELGSLDLSLDALARLEGFRVLDEKLQSAVEGALKANAQPSFVELAEQRLTGFWASVVPEVMQRWALIAAIGRVLLQADRVEAEAKVALPEARELARRYVESASPATEPWALLDAAHRHMERQYHHFELDVTGTHLQLEQLVAQARRRYTAAATVLAEKFVRALRSAGFRVEGFPRQVETFRRFVQPALEAGKTVYVLVDGLRYEMARELHVSLDSDHEAELAATLGTLPSITEIGMAALLPRAHEGAELVPVGGGKLGLRIGASLLRNRKERLEYLATAAGVSAYATRLEALLPPSKKVRDAIDAADLIVVTATDELDGLCETGNVPMARRLMDDVLRQIRRGLRVLFDLGVKTAVVTSDHGFLFGETLDSGNTIDSPGGHTVDLHRRVWVGKGGAASGSYLRVRAADVGLGGDLELAMPWSLAGFSAPGASDAYFHGAASPQELIVPVWTVRRTRSSSSAPSAVTWVLTPGSRSVSTRFLSVQIEGQVSGLFQVEPPRVRVEVREGKTALSRPVASAYGFEDATGSVKMELATEGRNFRPNTVTLMLEETPKGRKVDVVLVDASTDRILATVAGVPAMITAF